MNAKRTLSVLTRSLTLSLAFAGVACTDAGDKSDSDATAGTDGSDGADGSDGTDGTDGADGADGGDGDSDGGGGSDGSDGSDGGDGSDGSDGSDGGDTPVDFASRGPHTVGHQVFEDDGRLIKAWYPADSDATEAITHMVTVRLFGPDAPPVPFLGASVENADPATDRGPYPLVVLSHGFGMNPEWTHGLAEHLASRGLVVLGPEHVEYDWDADVLPATIDRPRAVSATIDFAETGVLDGIIDTGSVAVIGHSYGGTTALSLAGARLHFGWLEEACATVTDPMTEDFFCTPFIGHEEVLATHMGLDAVPTELWPSLADSRVDTIVAYAPDAGMFGPTGLAEVAVPSMMLAGTGDTAAPWDWGAGLAFDNVSSDPAAIVGFEGGEHFLVTTTCDHMPWTEGLPAEYASFFCEDPAWDKAEALALINETTAAWLAWTLQGDEAGRDALESDALADVAGLSVTVDAAER